MTKLALCRGRQHDLAIEDTFAVKHGREQLALAEEKRSLALYCWAGLFADGLREPVHSPGWTDCYTATSAFSFPFEYRRKRNELDCKLMSFCSVFSWGGCLRMILHSGNCRNDGRGDRNYQNAEQQMRQRIKCVCQWRKELGKTIGQAEAYQEPGGQR